VAAIENPNEPLNSPEEIGEEMRRGMGSLRAHAAG